MRKMVYLAFCDKDFCGLPNQVTKEIMRIYFSNEKIDGFYCKHCKTKTIIPDYIKRIANEL